MTQTAKVTAMTKAEARGPGWIPDLNSFGARLALIRHHKGWNLAEAARECDVPVPSWRNWEDRGREPRGLLNVCMKIAGVTGVDLNWLVMGPAGQPTPAAPLPYLAEANAAYAGRVTSEPSEGIMGSTRGYRVPALGERVVAVADGGSPMTSSDRANVRTGVRTRPKER